jgi:hypothetical protein
VVLRRQKFWQNEAKLTNDVKGRPQSLPPMEVPVRRATQH